jgi:Transglutaminase-like superfamily
MVTLDEYARHSDYTDPGRFGALLDAVPADVHAAADVAHNVIVHYRAAGYTFTGDRLAEIDNRWVERILATDQGRFAAPLSAPRPEPERVAGCCRDFTLLTVAALRHQGVPARSRIGFATYFRPDFSYDHVVVEYRDGQRWAYADAQLVPGPDWPFDTRDIPRRVGAHPAAPPLFATAAQVWTAFRAGEIDADRYGVDPELPHLCGGWVIYNYVLLELAHRQRDELLLWDGWGAMRDDLDGDPDGDLGLVDEVAALLLAADDGDDAAERELADRYAKDDRLRPGDRIISRSPTGTDLSVDLRTRAATPASAILDS